MAEYELISGCLLGYADAQDAVPWVRVGGCEGSSGLFCSFLARVGRSNDCVLR